LRVWGREERIGGGVVVVVVVVVAEEGRVERVLTAR